MRRVACAWVSGFLLGAAALSASGCSKAHTGSPVLIGARWVVAGQELETFGKTGLVVPPGAQRLSLVFDRRLDGSKIEDGSGPVPRPKADPPVHVAFAGQPSGYGLTVVYASNATGGPAIWASPAGTHAFPAGKTLTFSLDAASITGTDGTPYTGLASVEITTASFGVDLLVPAPGDATPTRAIPIAFNNPPDVATLAGHLRVLEDGREVPTLLFVDNRNRQLWNLQAACGAGWPVGRTLTVVVDAAVTDLYGAPLVSAASATFSVAGDAGTGTSCSGGDAGQGGQGGQGGQHGEAGQDGRGGEAGPEAGADSAVDEERVPGDGGADASLGPG